MHRVLELGKPSSDDHWFAHLHEAIDCALEMSRIVDRGYAIVEDDQVWDVHFVAFGGSLLEDGEGAARLSHTRRGATAQEAREKVKTAKNR